MSIILNTTYVLFAAGVKTEMSSVKKWEKGR